MIVIAVVNTKGGVGKTTLSAALAVRAAQEGKRVAIVDLDPQRSLAQWWDRRGRSDNLQIFEGVDEAADAVERAERDGWDWLFLDGPPAFLVTIAEMIEAADFVLVPIKPSMIDLLATEDTIELAREAGTAYLCVLNDVGAREKAAEKARGFLLNHGIPIAQKEIVHRVSHISGMAIGRSAAEGRDKEAAAEIDALWHEVKKEATKAAKARLGMKARSRP